MDTIHILNLNQIFAEPAHCLSLRLGVDIKKDFVPEAGHTYIVFGLHEEAPTLFSCQVSLAKEGKPFKFIIINSEPPQSDHLRNKYYLALLRSNVVWDYHPISSAFLKSLGIRVYSQYHFEFLDARDTLGLPREIDLLFVGSRSPRREALFKKLQERYPEKKIVFDLDWAHKDHNSLRKLLQTAKVVLNVPFYESGILETHRINSALANGCQVVSLYSGDKSTDDFYEPYIHFAHDLFELFDEAQPLPPKLNYAHLINALSPTVQHNKWILKQLLETSPKGV